MKIVLVDWFDASSDSSWHHLSELEVPLGLTQSVGFLIKETEQVLTLAHTYDEETDLVNGVINIPVEMVRKLRVVWPRAKRK